MRPKLELLDKPLIERILDEAFQLIEDPGVRVDSYVEDLLRAAGITVKDGVAHIPEVLARRLLDLVPRGFCLYDRFGKPAVHYSGDAVHFDPGSSCLNTLDPETQQPRPAMSADLARLVQVAETLPQFAAQSTANGLQRYPARNRRLVPPAAGSLVFRKAGGHGSILSLKPAHSDRPARP